MLSQKTLADIVKDEIKDKIRKGEIDEIYPYYYILPDGKIYPEDDYDVEVANGTLSANDIYAYVDVDVPLSFDIFL
ncbi:MAG: hypothetical protein OWT28_04795, partial [Firmicutes bacterium]|nr:hypothetical protein [Bacillota bacterium]